MKEKIIAIAILGSLLLTSVAGLSVAGTKTVNINGDYTPRRK